MFRPTACSSATPAGDRTVVYVNAAFCRLTGYEPHELLGKNPRLLQGDDRDQPELDALRESLRHAEPARALLRNQRKDGTVFVNEMQIYPLRMPTGKVTHFIGYHREGGARHKTSESGIRGLPNWVREDRLTGLASRYYFEDVLKRDFALAQRDKTEIALLLFDIDQLGPYNEIFDRAGGDAVVKRVARAIAGAFRRGTDIVGRWEGASVIALMHGTPGRSRDPARDHHRAPRARAADPSSALAAEVRDRQRRRRHPHGARRGFGGEVPEGGRARGGARERAGPQPRHRRGRSRLPLRQRDCGASCVDAALSVPPRRLVRVTSAITPNAGWSKYVGLNGITRRDSASVNTVPAARAEAGRRIGRLVVQRHAEVQVRAALEVDGAREAGHVSRQLRDREAGARTPRARRLLPGEMRDGLIVSRVLQFRGDVVELELARGN